MENVSQKTSQRLVKKRAGMDYYSSHEKTRMKARGKNGKMTEGFSESVNREGFDGRS